MSFKFDRRHFIITSFVAGAGALAWHYGFRSSSTGGGGVLVGGGRAQMNGQDTFYVALHDFADSDPKYKSLPFLPHGFTFHPLKPNIVSTFEKKGPGACEIDLATGHMTRSIATSPARYFYGHGAYSLDGKLLYATETILVSSEGVIVVRDADTMQVIGEFPSYGANPHDCHLIENGNILAITNGGGDLSSASAPNVTYVDINDQKLLYKYEFDNPHHNAGHLAVSDNKELVVVSAPRLGLPETDLGGVSLLVGDKLVSLKEPQDIVSRFKSETLSVCIHKETEIFGVTSPAGNFVSFWNLHSGQFVKSVEMPGPRGIRLSQDRTKYIVSYGAQGTIAFIDTRTFEIDKNPSDPLRGFTGSHLYIWNPKA